MKNITIITIIFVSIFITNIFFARNTSSYSARPAQLELNPNQTTNEISNSLDKLIQNVFQGFSGGKNINIDTNIPLSPTKEVSSDFSGLKLNDIFNAKNLSSQDIVGAIRAILVLLINLFFVVINIVIEILKGLLGALNNNP